MLFLLLSLGLSASVLAQDETIEVRELEAFWEDSVAVIHPRVYAPFSTESSQALHSGLPVAIDLDVRLTRVGFVKRLDFRIEVWYNVWKDRYRVITPIGPLAMEEYYTLLKYFREDLVIPLPRDTIPAQKAWFVRVRACDRGVLPEAMEDEMGGEMKGLIGWLFNLGERGNYSEWSDRTRLEPPEGSGP
jgi:hypothetical protein